MPDGVPNFYAQSFLTEEEKELNTGATIVYFVTTNKGTDTHRLVGSVLYLNRKRKTSESAISDDTMIEVAKCGDSTIEAVMNYYREYVCALNS